MLEHKTIKLKGLIGFLFTFTTLLSSCYYDNEEELYPSTNISCDTSSVTYGQDVSKIITDNCLSCHSAAINSGNIILEGHSSLKAQADNGKLMGVITHAPGHSPMPKNGNKLSDCTIAIIKKWVDSGSPNN
jgi:mono/diheme cytochrome c family protein